jgi:hypothetical protein
MAQSTDTNFVASITLRNGRVIYAADYGLKGFPIRGGKKRKPKG